MFNEIAYDIRTKGVLLKISGKALGEEDGAPYSKEHIEHIIGEICSIYNKYEAPRMVVVVGGGNIWRGNYGKNLGLSGPGSDEIGIFATMTNAMMVAAKLVKCLGDDRVEVMMTCMDNSTETYKRKEVKKALADGKIVVLGGGIGTTGMSTDFVAVNRAINLELGAVLMAKDGVDGVYDRNPAEEGARKYKTLNYKEFITKELKVADNTAVLAAKEASMPLIFFGFSEKGALKKLYSAYDIVRSPIFGNPDKDDCFVLSETGTIVADVPTEFA